MHFNEDSLATCAPIRKPQSNKFKAKAHRTAALRSLDQLIVISGRLYWVNLRQDFHAITNLLKQLGTAAWTDLSALSPRDWQLFEKREVTKASLNELNFAILKWSADRNNLNRQQLTRVRVRAQFLHQRLRSNSGPATLSQIVLDLEQADAFAKQIKKSCATSVWDRPMVNLARFVFWAGGREALARFTTAINRVPKSDDRFVIMLERAVDWIESLQKRLATESKLAVTHDFQNSRLREELHAWMQRKQLPNKLKGSIGSRLQKSIENYQAAGRKYRHRTEVVLPSQVASLSVCIKQGDELLQHPIDRAFAASCDNHVLKHSAGQIIEMSSTDCFPDAVRFFNRRPPQPIDQGYLRRVARQIAEGNRLEDINYVLQQKVGVDSWVRVRPMRQMLERFTRIFSGRGESPDPSDVFSYVHSRFEIECADCVLRWLELFPAAVFTSGLCNRTYGVLRQLQSLSQVSAFRGPIKNAMRVWSNRAQQIRDRFENENEIPQQLRSWLRRLTWFQRLAGQQQRLPSSLTKFLSGPKRQQRELQHLAALDERKQLNHKQLCRLNSLIEKPFNQPQFEKQATERAMELCVLAAMESLRTLLSNIVREAWTDIAGHPLPQDWSDQRCIEFGEWAAEMAPHQKKLLRQTLSAYAQHGAKAKRHLPFNLVWIEKQNRCGRNIDAWLSPDPERIRIGDSSFLIEVSNDPFQLFLMGSIFNTCLAPGGCNEMATLANSADANKQVIYVRNDTGQIVARKLIAISRESGLVGYHFYIQSSLLDESGCEQLKTEVTSFCRRLAQRVGIELADCGEPIGVGHFWYDDGNVDWNATN